MSWGLVVGGLVSAGSAYMQSRAGERGADAQQRAGEAATAESARQFDITQENMRPWLEAGGWALDGQRNFLQGDMSGFYNSAPFLAGLRGGADAIRSGATADHNLWGGGTAADLTSFGIDFSQRYAGDHFNRLAGMSNTGQTTAGQLGQFGAQHAQYAGNNMLMGGQAQASAYANTANSWGNFANQLVGGWNQWRGNGGG